MGRFCIKSLHLRTFAVCPNRPILATALCPLPRKLSTFCPLSNCRANGRWAAPIGQDPCQCALLYTFNIRAICFSHGSRTQYKSHARVLYRLRVLLKCVMYGFGTCTALVLMYSVYMSTLSLYVYCICVMYITPFWYILYRCTCVHCPMQSTLYCKVYGCSWRVVK